MGDIAVLKRVRYAGSDRSVAEQLFLRAWCALLAGQDIREVSLRVCADALASCRLGALDDAALTSFGLPSSIRDVAVAQAGLPWSETFIPALRTGLATGAPPPFAAALCEQPRAGATRPGHRRLPLWPAESHGDHCLLVAVGAVLASVIAGHDTALPFLAGLAHHLHNARLPDIGFEGEILLGADLEPLVDRLQASALEELPPALAAQTRRALDIILDAATPEGRAFHAADVIDRVLEVHYHADVAAFRAEQALDDMELVHPGPLQAFQKDVLREAGLA